MNDCVVNGRLRTQTLLIWVLVLLDKASLGGTLRFRGVFGVDHLGRLYFGRGVRPYTTFIGLARAHQTRSIVHHVLLL